MSIVNSTHQSILSDDVLQHFGETRNLNGDYSGQVKFSLREYTYEALTAKPDMRVTKVNDSVSYRPTREARKEIVARAIENAKKIGRTNENGNAVVRVADTGDEVILSAKGLRHGLDRRFSVNAPVTLKAGEIIRNAIRINEFTPENAQMDASYALIGAAKNAKNEPYIVQFVVNRYSNEVSSIDVLYAVNAKKEPGALLPDVTSTDVPAILTDSVISIRSLLDYVNRRACCGTTTTTGGRREIWARARCTSGAMTRGQTAMCCRMPWTETRAVRLSGLNTKAAAAPLGCSRCFSARF